MAARDRHSFCLENHRATKGCQRLVDGMRSLGRQQHFVNDSLSSKIPDRGLVSNCPKLVDYIGELGEASGFVMAFFFLNWCRFERTSTNPLKRLRSVQG